MSTCQHRNTTFSRDICPGPCGVMHTSCDDCYELLDDCAHDSANWTTQQAQAAQAELDDLERTDPDVAAAAASYDRMVEKMTGHKMRAEHCEVIDGARVRISDDATDADRATISEIVAAAKRYIAEREAKS